MAEKIKKGSLIGRLALTFAFLVGPSCYLMNEFWPRPYKVYTQKGLEEDSKEVIIARMLFGEARNCSDEENIMIAYTAINRANDGKKWNGEQVEGKKGTALTPWQYSCFNSNDPNRSKLMDPYKWRPFSDPNGNNKKAFDRSLRLARKICAGKYSDPTNEATHYFNPKAANPSWARDESMIKIGKIQTPNGQTKHEFYRER